MIRFRTSEPVEIDAVVAGAHPGLSRILAHRLVNGWTIARIGTGTVVTRTDAVTRTDWGPWKPGLDGLEFSTIEPLPAFKASDWLPVPELLRDGLPVRLKCGAVVPVAPSYMEGVEVNLDGSLAGPVSTYGQVTSRLWDRSGNGPIAPNEPDVIQFCRLAISSVIALPAEAIHAWHLLSTTDVQALFNAATTLPKAEADEHSSP